MSVQFDTSGVAEFGAALSRVDPLKAVESIGRRAALEVKRGMQADTRGHKHFPHLGAAVSYEQKKTSNVLEFHIGPVSSGQGSMAMFWFGNSKMAPQAPDPVRYLNRQAEVSIGHVGLAIARALQ